MNEKNEKSTQGMETTFGTRLAYAHGTLADNLALQNFLYLGFTFYFAVVGLPVLYISLGFIIYSIWDAINDPLLGVLSDKTKTRWGRRKPWIYASTIPLCIVMVLIWMPPTDSIMITFLYFVFMLILFDFVFTSFTVPFNSLWPEMFLNNDDRASVGALRILFAVLGVGIAYLLPEFIIEDIANKHNLSQTPEQYVLNGIIAAIIVFIVIIILLKFGSFERTEFSKDVEGVPSWKESYKITFKNKAFMTYCGVALAVFIVYNILPVIIPLYAIFVLKMEDPGLILFVGLLFGVFSAPLWMHFRKRWGIRKTYIVILAFWAF
ncbi:MAG: MFS transporter, partial [Candidatus Hermodarchaeota archaeon]